MVEEEADNSLSVTGNSCQRGVVYAQEEVRDPKRVVTATCAVDLREKERGNGNTTRRVPVKTLLPCPKGRINELLADLYSLKVKLPVKSGDPVISDWRGTGITVVATRTMN